MNGPFAALRKMAGWRLWVIVAIMLAAGIAEAVGIVTLVPLIAIAADPSDGAITSSLFDRLGIAAPSLTTASLVFVLAIAVRIALSMARDRQTASLLAGFEVELGEATARGMLAAPWTQTAALGRGGVQARLGNDVIRAADAASRGLTIIVMLLLLAIQFSAAFLIAPMLAVSATAIGLVLVLLLWPAVRAAHADGEKAGALYDDQLEGAQALYAGLKTAAAEGNTPGFLRNYRRRLEAMAALNVRIDRRSSDARGWMLALAALAGLAIVWIGGRGLGLDAVSLGTMLLLFARMSAPLQAIQQAAQQYAVLAPAYDRLAPYLLAPPSSSQRPAIEWREICAEGLGVRPPVGEWLFEDLGFTLKRGEWLGIGGASGVGKTSLVDVIALLRHPDHGRLLIDGQPVAPDDRWGSAISYIAAGPAIAAGPLRDLLSHDDSVSDDQRHEALQRVGLDEWPWPDGLDTIVEESGPALSAGERQRVALARALLRDPSLLILDEALSMLDSEAARALIDRVRADFPETAAILVSHRDDLLQACDRRMVLKGASTLHI